MDGVWLIDMGYLTKASKGRGKIVLSSGDIDFVPAMSLARKDNPNIDMTLLTFDVGVHEELIKQSTVHLLFEDHPRTIRR